MIVSDAGVLLNKTEVLIIERLLNMSADEFSQSGCNDLPKDFYKGTDAEELNNIIIQLNHSNCPDGSELAEDFPKFNDSIMMRAIGRYLQSCAEAI